MKSHPSSLRITILGLFIGAILGSIYTVSALISPGVSFGGISANGSYFTNYFSRILVDTSLTTDGTVRNADTLSGVDSSGYQRRIAPTCPETTPVVEIRPDGSVDCASTSIYSWKLSPTWGPCSVTCGRGTQTQEYLCVDENNNTVVADMMCLTAKPAALTGNCNTQSCSAPLSCNNGVQDGTETDTDCGGPSCSACSIGDIPGTMAGYGGGSYWQNYSTRQISEPCFANSSCPTAACAAGIASITDFNVLADVPANAGAGNETVRTYTWKCGTSNTIHTATVWICGGYETYPGINVNCN